LLSAVFTDDVYRTAAADHELRALPVRVAAAGRSQGAQALDPERHRRRFGNDNFAVGSRMTWQVDSSYVIQIETSR